MKQIKKKLHSNKGASIMLALALTLICLMVSSVIVAAAASGAYRNKQELIKQQEYLAITSAAEYIAKNLNTSNNYKFCGVYYNDEKICKRYSNYVAENVEIGGTSRSVYRIPTPYPYVTDLAGIDILDFYLVNEGDTFHNASPDKGVLESATSFSGIFKDMMKEAAIAVYKSTNEDKIKYKKEFIISITDDMGISDTRIPDVKCVFQMDEDYQVEIIVGSESGNSQYTLSVDLPAFAPVENDYGYSEPEECSHHCIYEYIDIDGNVAVKEEYNLLFSHNVSNSTTTVTWGSPVINRGGSGL